MVAWGFEGASYVNYQLSDAPDFSRVLYEDTVPPPAVNHVTIALPSQSGAYYVRARVQYPDGTWSDWLGAVGFRVDQPILTVEHARARYNVTITSADVSVKVGYADGALAPAVYGTVTVTYAGGGASSYADAWWTVDVYSGCNTGSEPPDSTYYSYLGTVNPSSTHSYFAHYYYPFDQGYKLMVEHMSPYWAKAVGAPDWCFALVYRSYVYVPQSGGYTFKMWTSYDGIKYT
jgi:hypothetical protein